MKPYHEYDFRSMLPKQDLIPYFESLELEKIIRKAKSRSDPEYCAQKKITLRPYNIEYKDIYKARYTAILKVFYRIEEKLINRESLTYPEIRSLKAYKGLGYKFWFDANYSDRNKLVQKTVRKLGRDGYKSKRIAKLNQIIEEVNEISAWTETKYQDLVSDLAESKSERNFWAPFLNELIKSGVIPQEAFELCLNFHSEYPISRFQRIYAIALQKAFPDLPASLVIGVMGKGGYARDPKVQFYKVIFDKDFGFNHLILYANDYTEAFGKATDLYMRICLFSKGVIPKDISIRIQHISVPQMAQIVKKWLSSTKREKGSDYEKAVKSRLQGRGDKNQTFLFAAYPKLQFQYIRDHVEEELINLRSHNVTPIHCILDVVKNKSHTYANDLGLDYRLSRDFQEFRPDIEWMDKRMSELSKYENNSDIKEMLLMKGKGYLQREGKDIESERVSLGIPSHQDTQNPAGVDEVINYEDFLIKPFKDFYKDINVKKMHPDLKKRNFGRKSQMAIDLEAKKSASKVSKTNLKSAEATDSASVGGKPKEVSRKKTEK